MLSVIDVIIFSIYFLAMLGMGIYFYLKNSSEQEYYIGDGKISAWHIGLSVVATDVGGGFSIGLGGLGFVIGISGSWMLFTGLLGAWLSAVLLIPKVKQTSSLHNFITFPQLFKHHFNANTAFIAGIISFIGYLGFTSSQLLAGAKLASATFPQIDWQTAVIIMGIIAISYTALGGIKAVIYTDTIQWIILMVGLIFLGIPFAYYAIGGWEAISATLQPSMFSLTNVSASQIINWMITIIPIWFVGMTLYQRIYASKNEKEAKKAWFIAGLFEYPIMAFMGVILGLFSRVAYDNGMLSVVENIDPEMGLPLLLKEVLPIGIIGLLMSAYFSAIMSTADSCLMAASGNFMTDLLPVLRKNKKYTLKHTVAITLVIGVIAISIALASTNVLELMLVSYAFMVSGLFIPTLAILFLKNHYPLAAIVAMLSGGCTTLLLQLYKVELPFALDPNFYGLCVSCLSYFFVHTYYSNLKKTNSHYE